MNKQIEALKMAIEWKNSNKYTAEQVIEACKEALAEAEKQEPVALIRHENGNFSPAPSWQGLSDNEIGKVLDDLDIGAAHTDWMINFAYAIEAKLKEKNKC